MRVGNPRRSTSASTGVPVPVPLPDQTIPGRFQAIILKDFLSNLIENVNVVHPHFHIISLKDLYSNLIGNVPWQPHGISRQFS